MQTGTASVRIPMRSGDEQDILCRRSRHLLKFTERSGACRAAKNSYARRMRKAGRLALKEEA